MEQQMESIHSWKGIWAVFFRILVVFLCSDRPNL